MWRLLRNWFSWSGNHFEYSDSRHPGAGLGSGLQDGFMFLGSGRTSGAGSVSAPVLASADIVSQDEGEE